MANSTRCAASAPTRAHPSAAVPSPAPPAPPKPGEIIWERDGQILRCPWHGWEFDIASGRSVFNPHRLRVRTYDVTVEQPPQEEEDPSVESFDVTVEDGWVVLHA